MHVHRDCLEEAIGLWQDGRDKGRKHAEIPENQSDVRVKASMTNLTEYTMKER
jgi:hypothetical protein